MLRRLCLAAALLALASASAFAAAPKPAARSAALSPERFRVERDSLPNGLQILLHEDHSVPAVCFFQWFRVGSRNERQGITGLSHFFEHMMFNGSANVPPKQYDVQLESQGAYSNAFTSYDQTAYYEEGGTASLETMMRLDADRMRSLSLLPDLLKSEVEVVREERRFRTDNSVPGMLDEALYSAAFVASPYHWPVVGWMKDLERITRDEMVEYFRTYYAPNNCTIIVSGDFDPAWVKAKLREYFGDIPRQAPPPRPVNAEPEQRGERRVSVHYPSETVTFVAGYKAPAVSDPDHYALEILASVLGGGESSRLHRALVYEQQIALSADAGFRAQLEPGLFEFWVEMKPGASGADGEKALYAELDRLVKDGPTERELQKARNQVESRFVYTLETNRGAAQMLGRYEQNHGDYRALFDAVDRYRAVTAADVQRVAKQVFDARRRTVATLVPENETEAAR
ncbi:MAG: insulinase family protein [Candidatus Eisenbacteria bacterium]|uniref:Insulinase family protein n=1 Tax=Eiseniibacteriota bacterium TaxID=2212470 RepID=A0A933SI19_UNCEI|nr:insulinase family protein [Candidatus Eisenbacteria bacterium]